MSRRDRGRRIPPKARGPRAAAPGDFDAMDAGSASGGGEPGPAGPAGAAGSSRDPDGSVLRATRAQNRAAKRAASGVRPKSVRGGPVRGRRSRQTNTPLILLAIAAVAVGAAVFAFGSPFGGPGASPSATAAASRPVYGDGSCPTSQPAALSASQKKYVTIETELGTIVIEVDGALSPIAAGNFVALAECEYYDGVVFHRTAALQTGTPFVIQGGDPDGTGRGGPGYTIADEPVTAAYGRGTVAMARTNAPNSQGSQFFIVLSEEAGQILKATNTYAIFGKVTVGMDVADAVYQASGGVELPANPIEMTEVTVSDTAPPTAAPTTAPSPAPTTVPTAARTTAPSPAP